MSPSHHIKPGGRGWLVRHRVCLRVTVFPSCTMDRRSSRMLLEKPSRSQDQLLPGPPEEVIIVSLRKAPGCQDENMSECPYAAFDLAVQPQPEPCISALFCNRQNGANKNPGTGYSKNQMGGDHRFKCSINHQPGYKLLQL